VRPFGDPSLPEAVGSLCEVKVRVDEILTDFLANFDTACGRKLDFLGERGFKFLVALFRREISIFLLPAVQQEHPC